MPFRPAITLLLLVVTTVLPAGCRREVPSAMDLDGRAVDPLAGGEARAVVLLFASNDCPISNRYVPEVKRLAGQFGPQGVRFWYVHADPDESPESVRRHRDDYKIEVGVLRDPAHALVRASGASTTPEAVVFAGGTLVYRGRIDDWFADYGKHRPEPTQRDLQEVLTSLVAGRPVTNTFARAIGCAIPGLKRNGG